MNSRVCHRAQEELKGKGEIQIMKYSIFTYEILK